MKIRLLLNVLALHIVALLSLGVLAGEHVTYYVNDALGSPIMALNQTGDVIWQESYQPYGQRQIKSVASQADEQFYTGKQEEPDIGLQYYGARWYDPEAGRFTSIDPVGVDEGNIHSFNRYAYANNNPYKYTDPDGRSAYTKIAKLVYNGGDLTATFIDVAQDASVAMNPAAPPISRVMAVISIGSEFAPISINDATGAYKWADKIVKNSDVAKKGKEYGSYTNTHASGNKYHGQGDRKRSQTSGKERAAENDDPHAATDWTPSSNRREAMKDEARRLRDDGGIENPNNYNKINSPGKKYIDQDGG